MRLSLAPTFCVVPVCRFMHYAAAADRVPWLKCLLKAGVEAHEQDCAGNTPLHAATFSGCANSVRFLLNEAKVDYTQLNTR